MNRLKISLNMGRTKNNSRDKGNEELKAQNPNFVLRISDFTGCVGFFKNRMHPCHNGGAA